VKLVAAGPVDEVFTQENLRLAYGGRVGFVGAKSAPDDDPASSFPGRIRP